jgi:hypothetical protein
MSLYEGTITLRLRFFSSNGVEADENLKDMGLEIATAVNSNCVDPDDATMPDDGCSSDSFIASLPPREFIGRYSAWHLGTPAWGHGFYDLAHSLDAARIDADATSQARQ